MSLWDKIPHKKNSGKEYSICPACSHTRKKKTDKCMSSDHDTGHYSCSHCGETGWKIDSNDKFAKTIEDKVVEKEYIRPVFSNKTDLPTNVLNWFLKRGINQNTLLHFKTTYGVEQMPKAGKWVESSTIQHNYFLNGALINTKYKTPDKFFKMRKDAEKIVFNMDSIKSSKEVLFCEGEEEAMVWYQSGYKHAVSVPNGAVLGKNNLDYIRKYWDTHFKDKNKVYIAVDNDEPGINLKEDLIRLFGKNICYIIDYPKLPSGDMVDKQGNTVKKFTKDANDLLLLKGEKFLMELLDNAVAIPLEGVFTLDDVRDEMWRQFLDKNAFVKGTTTYKPNVDENFTWMRGDFNLFFGPGNQGKSTFLNELLILKSMNEGTVWGIFSPEQNPPIRFYNSLIRTYIGGAIDPNFHNQMSKDDYERGLNFVQKHFIYVYPDESHDIQTIFGIFKSIIVRNDIDGVIIDPFNQLEKMDNEAKLRDDQYISKFGKDFKRFLITHNVYSMVITHGDFEIEASTNKIKTPNMYKNIEGGKMWSKKVDNILYYFRPNILVNKRDSLCVFGSSKIKHIDLTGTPGDHEYSYDHKTNRYLNIDGIDDFTRKKSPTAIQRDFQLTFPEESYGNARPSNDYEEIGTDDEPPF